MTRMQAVRTIRMLAAAGKVLFTKHAIERMDERAILPVDARHALAHVKQAIEQPWNGHWKCTGPNREGAPVRLVVRLESDILVITTWDPQAKEN